MPGRKLKVFQAQFGFYDTVVAAASQAAALRAWGTHQNLFASGEARVTTDKAAVAAAMAQPEIVLKRAVGSQGAFEVDPRSLPEVPDAPKKAAPRAAKPSKPERAAAPVADRRDLDQAEAALHAVDGDRKAEEARLRERQAALDADKETAQAAYVDARKAATARVVKAREAYREAGGRD